jgi:hypothetical protein
MLVKLLLLGGVGIAALIAYDHGRSIDEADVRAHYRTQLEALRAFDEEAICAGIADDYVLELTERTPGGDASETLDGPESCDVSRKMLGFMRQMSEQTGGLVTIDVSYTIGTVTISPDGRKATVESTSTAKLGDRLISRSRGREELSRSFWRTRSHGGTAQVWSYGG